MTNERKKLTACREHVVEFFELDPMNIVWHGTYTHYFERARSDLLDMIGYNYKDMKDSGYIFPVVDMRVKYIRPLTLKQKIKIEAYLEEYENRLKITYCIFDAASNEICTKATTIQVAVNEASKELEFETPRELIERIERLLV